MKNNLSTLGIRGNNKGKNVYDNNVGDIELNSLF